MAEISLTTDRALVILNELGSHGVSTATQLAQSLDLDRAAVRRLLATLEDHGFVARRGAEYLPGSAVLQIAVGIAPDLRTAATPAMRATTAKLRETTVLHVPDGLSALVLQQVCPTDQLVFVEHQVGSRHLLGEGASGLALLAFMSAKARARVVRRHVDPADLGAQLEGVRDLGFAISHDELQEGVHGVAAPVLTRSRIAIASVAILVPGSRADLIGDYSSMVMHMAADISRRLARGGTNA